MADERARIAVKIVDPTTNANEMGVDASGNAQVVVNAALPAGDNNIGDVDIASGPSGASALEIQGPAADGASAVGDPLQIGGVDGAGNMQRLATDTDGHLQIDVLTGGGETMPSNPTGDTASSSDTAAGVSANLDSAVINGQEYLAGADLTASVPFKFQIQSVAASTITLATGFGRAGEVVQWRPPHRHFAGLVGDNVDDVFRAVVTNMDNSQAADLYAAFYYQDN